MVSLFRCCFVLIPIIFSIATIILGALAIAGSTTNKNPVNEIYLIRLNLTDIDLSSVVGTSVTTTASSLGLSDIYSFGLWGYCKGSSDSGSYDVTYCSKPKAMYGFDPASVLSSELGSSYNITLPSDVENYVSKAKVISKLIFITAIIGVCLSVVTGILTVFSFCSHGVSCLSYIVGLLSFLSLVIAAGAATGAFMIIKKYFNDATDSYGISAELTNYYFYAFIWAACGAALLTGFFNFFAICCGRTASKPKSPEAQPMMHYDEKSI